MRHTYQYRTRNYQDGRLVASHSTKETPCLSATADKPIVSICTGARFRQTKKEDPHHQLQCLHAAHICRREARGLYMPPIPSLHLLLTAGIKNATREDEVGRQIACDVDATRRYLPIYLVSGLALWEFTFSLQHKFPSNILPSKFTTNIRIVACVRIKSYDGVKRILARFKLFKKCKSFFFPPWHKEAFLRLNG